MSRLLELIAYAMGLVLAVGTAPIKLWAYANRPGNGADTDAESVSDR